MATNVGEILLNNQGFKDWMRCFRHLVNQKATTGPYPPLSDKEIQKIKNDMRDALKELSPFEKRKEKSSDWYKKAQRLIDTPINVKGGQSLPSEFGYIFLLALNRFKKKRGQSGGDELEQFIFGTGLGTFSYIYDKSRGKRKYVLDKVAVVVSRLKENSSKSRWRVSLQGSCLQSICNSEKVRGKKLSLRNMRVWERKWLDKANISDPQFIVSDIHVMLMKRSKSIRNLKRVRAPFR